MARKLHISRILIAGLGVTGFAVFEYFCRIYEHELTEIAVASDSFSAEDVQKLENFKAHSRKDFNLKLIEFNGYAHFASAEPFELCVISPGIAPSTALYEFADEHSLELISEPELSYRAYERTWIGVTGTNGKTTCTSLIAHIFNEAGRACHAVGNIGLPAILALEKEAIVCAELSSFQLHAISELRFKVATILNLSPDHLNWHASLDEYYADKARIFENSSAGDLVILNAQDRFDLKSLARLAGSQAEIVKLDPAAASSELKRWVRADEIKIKGAHNHYNALVAALSCSFMDLSDEEIRQGLMSFEPVAHRLQLIGMHAGVEYYNDSKATNPEASMAALDAFDEKPFHLLLGGKNKGNSFVELLKKTLIKPELKSLIFFGDAADELSADFEIVLSDPNFADHIARGHAPKVQNLSKLQGAFDFAAKLAQAGESVVLSPACASFDEFRSFEHRGEYFCELFESLVEASHG